MIFRPRRDLFGLDLLTTRADLLLQPIQALVRSIGDAFFHQRPDPLTGIQLRRVSRDAQQGDALRDIQGRGPMRRRTVPDQKDALALSGMLFGEGREESLHARGIKPWQDEPEDSPRLRVRRRIEPEPFVALIDFTDRTLSRGCPDAAQDRLETEARLVLAPDFDLIGGVRLSQSLSLKLYLFLNSACSSTEARRLF
jgi:hypothetical protein